MQKLLFHVSHPCLRLMIPVCWPIAFRAITENNLFQSSLNAGQEKLNYKRNYNL
jgi:hypothetical protein